MWLIHLPLLILELDLLIRLGVALYILYHKRPSGRTTAWVVLTLAIPFVGLFLYALIGENRLGKKRHAKMAALLNRWQEVYLQYHKRWQPPQSNADEPLKNEPLQPITPPDEPIFALGLNATHLPPIGGNHLQVFDQAHEAMDQLIEDIHQAKESIWLCFFIWENAGKVEQVSQALTQAAQRGVNCTLMVDSVGSKVFLKSKARKQLQKSDVDVIELLPVNMLRFALRRIDLRNHRKIVVIDDRLAYTGSLNMADPTCFKQKADVGQWVDVMIRVDGPATEPLKLTTYQDYIFERDIDLNQVPKQQALLHKPLATKWHDPGAWVQVFPSGPGIDSQSILQLFASAIHNAKQQITLTTPYFVPDSATLTAILTAARRGLDVTLIVPEKVDSPLVRFAGTAFFDELLEAGVKIAQFQGGLLHAKAMTIDGNLTLIGSANMDMRSFFINEEITLVVADQPFTQKIDELQQTYLNQSQMLDLQTWSNRPMTRRLVERITGLMGPLL